MSLAKVLNAVNVLTVAVIGFFIVKFLGDKLSVFEAATVVVLPLALSISTYYSVKLLIDDKHKSTISAVTAALADQLSRLGASSARFHGPKIAIPNQGFFWNQLLVDARKRFLLCSTTNKSWFDKSIEQSKQISEQFVRLIEDGGSITIASKDDPEIIGMTERFLKTYLRATVQRLPLKTRSRLRAEFESRFEFVSHSGVKYSATLSDDRLLLIPLMNTDQFRDESVVFEIDAKTHSAAFNNFISDIDRVCVYNAKKHPAISMIFD